MSRTPETDNLARGNHVVPTEFARDLERERDELRADQINHENLSMRYMDERDRAEKMLRIAAAKVEAQAERIRQLDSATNHAGGTPLSQWRECAAGLASALHQMRDIPDYADFALTQFERLKEGSK
jgi:hypothetical protein